MKKVMQKGKDCSSNLVTARQKVANKRGGTGAQQ
jgi:hypothetical protein